eukprot:3428568-Prymnesium_polylepis.1
MGGSASVHVCHCCWAKLSCTATATPATCRSGHAAHTARRGRCTTRSTSSAGSTTRIPQSGTLIFCLRDTADARRACNSGRLLQYFRRRGGETACRRALAFL